MPTRSRVQVNIELLLDLFANLRAMLRDEQTLPPQSAIQCVHALLRLLSGHGQVSSGLTQSGRARCRARAWPRASARA